MSNDFGDSLAALKDLYGKTKPQSQVNIDDGIYQFSLESAELTSTPDKESGVKIPTVLMRFKVITPGNFENVVVTSWDKLNKPQSISFFKEKLARLGANPDAPIEELPVEIQKLVGCICTASISNKMAADKSRTFTNIFVRQLDQPAH